jgi:hypothetical protein
VKDDLEVLVTKRRLVLWTQIRGSRTSSLNRVGSGQIEPGDSIAIREVTEAEVRRMPEGMR